MGYWRCTVLGNEMRNMAWACSAKQGMDGEDRARLGWRLQSCTRCTGNHVYIMYDTISGEMVDSSDQRVSHMLLSILLSS